MIRWPSRPRLTLLIFYVCLVCLVIFCYRHLHASEKAARTAALNVSECRRLVERIGALRHQPVLAGIQRRSSEELSERIDRIGKQANFASSSIQSIDPQTPTRVGETAYKGQTTQIELRDVTLPQLAHFLRLLTEEDSELRMSSIRLSAPQIGASASIESETWRAELTLTYLIFSPKSSSSGS
jgi:hypothetical protein